MTRRVLMTSMAAVALFAAPVALGAVSPAGAATASPTPTATGYPVTTDPGTVTAATIYTGNRVGFSGGGFMPLSAVTITEDIQAGGSGMSAVIPAGVVANLTASAGGTFGITLTLTVVGHTTLTASGMGTDGRPHTDVSVVTVLPLSAPTPTTKASGGSKPTTTATAVAGPTTGPTTQANGGSKGDEATGVLPKTGADNVGIELWLGGGLLLVGGAVVVGMSRRRTSPRR